MAGLLTYHKLQKFIPENTEYRCKIARLHIKRYGCGSPLPENKSPRMRVDDGQFLLQVVMWYKAFPLVRNTFASLMARY
jgi:hypothetical protein